MFNFFKRNKNNGYDYETFVSYVRSNLIDKEEGVATYDDGRKIRFTTKSLYPLNSIDGEPLYNAFGQQAYNNLYKEKGIS